MAVKKTADITKVGHDVLTTAMAENGLVTAQTGDVVAGKASANNSEVHFPPGIVGRPRTPDAGSKAAQIVAITRGDNDAIIGFRDERIVDVHGQLADGETAVFASAKGGGVAIFKADGSIQIKSGNGEMVATVTNTGITLGPSPQAVTFGSFTQQFLIAVQTFATSMNGDPLLPILLPSTYSAAQALVAAMLLLVEALPTEGQTQNTTAT